jgi:hypothetical protein
MDSAAIAGTAVGLAGVTLAAYTQWSNVKLQESLSERQADHARRLAHDAHTYESKRDAYLDVLITLNRLDTVMSRTEPIIGPVPEPPPLPDDEELAFRQAAALAAFGSRAVYDAFLEYNKLWFAFKYSAQILQDLRVSNPRGPVGDAYKQVQADREAGRAQLEKIERLINGELGTP